MCTKNICKHIAVYVLSAMLVLSASMAIPVMEVRASNAGAAGSLIGSGAADEINISRILDMALNKSGIVMSPSAIRTFLEFWWTNVRSDIQILIGDVDSTVTTVTDFVKWVESNWTSTEKPKLSKVADISLRFLKYCTLQDSKTLSDFKQLITQEGTFREFLLSYVTDSDGNLAGSVNNKLAKYNLKSGLISMVRQAADCYIEEHEGYYLIKTHKVNDLSSSHFDNKSVYDSVLKILNTMSDDSLVLVSYFTNRDYRFCFYDLLGFDFVLKTKYSSGDNLFSVDVYNDQWVKENAFGKMVTIHS